MLNYHSRIYNFIFRRILLNNDCWKDFVSGLKLAKKSKQKRVCQIHDIYGCQSTDIFRYGR